MNNPRFNQLYTMASDGDEASIGQLWHEFGFDFFSDTPDPDSAAAIGENSCGFVGNSSSVTGGAPC